MYIRFEKSVAEDFGIDIISVGNLSVGGNGKTPVVTALAQKYQDVAIVLRGYGRGSQGLFVVHDGKKTLCDVSVSGDEAMIYAHKVPHAIVIVSEDRKEGIKKAKALGAKIIFLDDAYSKHGIKKLDFVIETESKNNACLPAGPFREREWAKKKVFTLKEQRDFKRVVELKNKNDKMSLVTAIAKPQRLDPFLPNIISKNYFEDHHSFSKDELEEIIQKDQSGSLLVTYKDFVKVSQFGFNISLLDLHVEIDKNILEIIENYRMQNAKKD